MSTLEQVTNAGLDEELMELIGSYGPADATVQEELLESIDRSGFKGPAILQKTAAMKNRFAKVGIYSALNAFGEKFAAALKGGNGKGNGTVQAKTDKETIDLSKFSFSDDQEAKIKARVEAEAQKYREREARFIERREKQIRERIAAGKPVGGRSGGGQGRVPAGVPADKAAHYIEVRTNLKALKTQRNDLAKQIIAAKEEMASMNPVLAASMKKSKAKLAERNEAAKKARAAKK